MTREAGKCETVSYSTAPSSRHNYGLQCRYKAVVRMVHRDRGKRVVCRRHAKLWALSGYKAVSA